MRFAAGAGSRQGMALNEAFATADRGSSGTVAAARLPSAGASSVPGPVPGHMPESGPEARAGAADEIDLARAQHYSLLANLLLRAPDAEMLARLAQVQGTPTPLGLTHIALAQAAAATDVARVQREYFELFIGVGRGELVPYASYYLTGFLYDRPLAALRADLSRLGLERAERHHDPEDHLGTLCEIMGGLAAGQFEAEPGEDARFFGRHVLPWAPRFFRDLEHAAAADFYRAVANVGLTFTELEAEAFAMAA